MKKLWKLEDDQATYILRYFLPRPPYCQKNETRKHFDELLKFCKETHIKALQFYVNFLPNWFYMPDTLEHTKEWAAEMKKFVPEIRAAGISYQLNYQLILGANTGFADMRDKYSWEYLVDEKGVINQGCACPLGQEFRKTMGQQLTAWAETLPDVLWIDDDFRMHNHQITFWDFYCYCPLHLKGFSEITGVEWTREKLVEAVLKPGKATAVRAQWLEYLNYTMTDTAHWISDTVHAASPNTRVAQMTSAPDIHAIEGRNWNDFLTAISGEGYKPVTRPHFGPYTEITPSAFLDSYIMLDQSICNIRQQYKGEVDFCPEIENTPFTSWSKSAMATKFQLRLGQLLGCPGITLSLFDLEGSPLTEEPIYKEVLENEKPVLDAIAKLKLFSWKAQGACLLSDSELGKKTAVNNPDNYSSLLGPGRTWDRALLQMGLPVFYTSVQDASQNAVTILDGTTAQLPDEETLKCMLSKGVLMDSEAAGVIIDRGLGEWIGIKNTELMQSMSSSEIFHGKAHNSSEKNNPVYFSELGDRDILLDCIPEKRMYLHIKKGSWYRLFPDTGAVVLSEIIDPKGKIYPGTVLFENAAGGRIAVYAGCVDLGAAFFNHQRVKWVTGLMDWLARGQFTMLPEAKQKTLAIRKDSGNEILLAFANLAADCIETLRGYIRDAGNILFAEILSDQGTWEKINSDSFQKKDDQYCFELKMKLQIYEWSIVKLTIDSRT